MPGFVATRTRLQSAEYSQSWRFTISPSRELYCDSLHMCILILVCPFFPYACYCCFIWNMFDVFVSVYLRCACVFYFFHTHYLWFCSFRLLFSCEILLGRFDFCNNTILNALNSLNLGQDLIRFIECLLCLRTVISSVGTTYFQRIVCRGAPQDGVLSPLIWYLAVNALL